MKCPYCIKVCTKCKRILVANETNFTKKKNGKYGLVARCKKCDKKYREDNKEKIAECKKKCYEKNKDHYSEYKTQWYQDNKEEITKRNKQNYQNNKEEFSKRNKNYRLRKKQEIIDEYNFIEIIKSNKVWNHCPFIIKVCPKCKRILVANNMNFRKDKDNKNGLGSECKKCKAKIDNKYYENNKEELKEKCKKYNQENPHVKINSHNKRRQKIENQGEGITKEQWKEMFEFFNWRCAYSGEYIGSDSDKRTIDHIIPLSKGGEHEIWNCVPMYGNYNYSKKTKDMLEWYKQQEFYSEERLNKIYEWQEYAKNKWNI